MPIDNETHDRLEFSYDGVLTVIEGSEYDLLEHHFRKYFEEEIAKAAAEHLDNGSGRNEFVLAVLESTCIVVLKAYQAAWGDDVVYLEELEELSTVDARKMDLFYKGKLVHQILALQSHGVIDQELDPEELFGEKKSVIESLNEVFVLRPSIFGVGININEIISKYLQRKKPNRVAEGL